MTPFGITCRADLLADALGGKVWRHPRLKLWRCRCPLCGGSITVSAETLWPDLPRRSGRLNLYTKAGK
jgi:hypothetical protein